MPEFNIGVEFSDSTRPEERIRKFVTVEADNDSQAKAHAGTAVVSLDAHANHGGNIASYSEVDTEIFPANAEGAEDPSIRDKDGRTLKLHFQKIDTSYLKTKQIV